MRTSKTVDNTQYHYIYNDGELLRQTGGGKTLDFIYDHDGAPYALIYRNGSAAAETYYYITNLQGDVMQLVDEDGNTAAQYSYDPYGNILSATGNMAQINPLRYRGYYFDAESGLYYLQSRYYDSKIGRFINADSIDYLGATGSVMSFNLFAYCENNPVNNTDTTGTFVIRRWMISAIIDFLLMLIPGIGAAFAPIKAMAKEYSKQALKSKIKTPLTSFIKFVASSSNTILRGIQKGLGRLPVVGKWLAKRIPVEKWVGTLSGVATSSLFNKVLTSLVENIDVVLSVGGAISGILDIIVDGKLNNRIWVF